MAAKIGVSTAAVIEAMLSGYKVEQQGYKACMALLKLSDTYTPERLESACAKALNYTLRPNYKSIQAILKSGQDRMPDNDVAVASSEANEFGFTRGANYYGRRGK